MISLLLTKESEKESSEEEVNEPSDDEGKETISTENVGLEYLVKKDNPEQPKVTFSFISLFID